MKLITAFTIAHSITLTLAALEIVQVSGRIVEPIIVASVIAAAVNNIRPWFGERAWMVAFGFGLVHGLGLAGGLMEGGFRREVLALAVVSFRERVVPAFRRASWPVQRVLTDRGSEFKGAFDEACRVLGIRHTRTKPRHAFTNGFVERLQQTILHDHWRVEFRRRYFTKSHHGYRTRGRTPAQLVWGAQDAEA